MRYNPDAATSNLIPTDTWCDAVIVAAIDTTSKNRNEMIETDFQVYDPQGLQPIVKHYFVSTAPGMFKKLCTVLNLNFESGNISAESLVDKKLSVLIKIQTDKTGQYGDKNVIAAFQASANGAVTPQPKADDGIPF